MFTKTYVIIVFIMITTCFIQSCRLEDNSNNDGVSNTQYGSREELENYAKLEGFVDYRVSRVFAVIESKSFNSENNWSNSTVSELPVIIYDNELKPKYYEFRVIKDGIEVGAIACNAQEKNGKPVQFILNLAPQYNTHDSRNKSDEYIIIDSGYPSSTVEKSKKASRDAGSIDNISFEVNQDFFISNADEKTLAKLGLTTDDAKQDLINKNRIITEESREYWRLINKYKDDIIGTDDSTIDKLVNSSMSRGNYVETYYPSPWYQNRNTKYHPGWCGPSALAYLAEMHHDGLHWYNLGINSTYTAFYNKLGNGPHIWEQLNPVLKDFSSLELDLGYWGDKSHDAKKVYDVMKAHGTPAISLRTWASINGVWSWSWHYRVIMGIRKDHTEWMEDVLWWKELKTKDVYYYLMTDNGADAKNAGSRFWWETAGSLAHFESVGIKK